MKARQYSIHWHYGSNVILNDCGYVECGDIFINPSAVSSQTHLLGCFMAGDVIYGQEKPEKTIFGKRKYLLKEYVSNLGYINLYAIKMINGDQFIVDIPVID